jgi:hypothetical protein
MPNRTTDSVVGASLVRHPTEYETLEPLLVDEPLHSRCKILLLFNRPESGQIAAPNPLHLHCDHQKCGGVRRHELQHFEDLRAGGVSFIFLRYKCTNCETNLKIFGIRAEGSTRSPGFCTKIYQEPPFGEPIPKRLFEVIGESNREFFLQARRAIARGLGIGAYGYYRRIVENTKFDLIGSILKVARAVNSSSQQIELLQKAESERQFSKAIELLRDAAAIPPVLLIDGHNPLLLLHDLLSEGIHELDDTECLLRAREAEVILCEIADRMQMALTERKNVKEALASIMNRKTKRQTETPTTAISDKTAQPTQKQAH